MFYVQGLADLFYVAMHVVGVCDQVTWVVVRSKFKLNFISLISNKFGFRQGLDSVFAKECFFVKVIAQNYYLITKINSTDLEINYWFSNWLTGFYFF